MSSRSLSSHNNNTRWWDKLVKYKNNGHKYAARRKEWCEVEGGGGIIDPKLRLSALHVVSTVTDWLGTNQSSGMSALPLHQIIQCIHKMWGLHDWIVPINLHKNKSCKMYRLSCSVVTQHWWRQRGKGWATHGWGPEAGKKWKSASILKNKRQNINRTHMRGDCLIHVDWNLQTRRSWEGKQAGSLNRPPRITWDPSGVGWGWGWGQGRWDPMQATVLFRMTRIGVKVLTVVVNHFTNCYPLPLWGKFRQCRLSGWKK